MNDRFKEDYQNQISLNSRECDYWPDEPQKMLNYLQVVIYNCRYKNQNSNWNFKSKVSKRKWFDTECRILRKLSFECLKASRDDDTDSNRHIYLRTNLKYRNMCGDKRILYYNSVVKTINESKNSKEFWGNVNQFKNKQYSLSNNIVLGEWISHFKNMYNCELNNVFFNVSNYNYDVSLDRPFTRI